MVFKFCWAAFVKDHILLIMIAIFTVVMFNIAPPEAWTHKDTMFKRTILIYFALTMVPLLFIYLLIDCLKPHSIKLNFERKQIQFGEKIIDIDQVQKVVIQRHKLSSSISITFVNIMVVFKIPQWYRVHSIPNAVLPLKSFCKRNNVKLIFIRD